MATALHPKEREFWDLHWCSRARPRTPGPIRLALQSVLSLLQQLPFRSLLTRPGSPPPPLSWRFKTLYVPSLDSCMALLLRPPSHPTPPCCPGRRGCRGLASTWPFQVCEAETGWTPPCWSNKDSYAFSASTEHLASDLYQLPNTCHLTFSGWLRNSQILMLTTSLYKDWGPSHPFEAEIKFNHWNKDTGSSPLERGAWRAYAPASLVCFLHLSIPPPKLHFPAFLFWLPTLFLLSTSRLPDLPEFWPFQSCPSVRSSLTTDLASRTAFTELCSWQVHLNRFTWIQVSQKQTDTWTWEQVIS